MIEYHVHLFYVYHRQNRVQITTNAINSCAYAICMIPCISHRIQLFGPPSLPSSPTHRNQYINNRLFSISLSFIKNRCRVNKSVNIRYMSKAVESIYLNSLKMEAVILICMYLIIICNIHQLNAVCNYHA